MMAETAPVQAGTTSGEAGAAGGPAGPGAAGNGQPAGRGDRMVRYAVWVAVTVRVLGGRHFQARVITGAIGIYALASVFKNNRAQPVRRALRWYQRGAGSAR